MFKCKQGESGIVHALFEDVECFTYPHVQHLVFAVFSVLFHVGATFLGSNCVFEHRKHTLCTSARRNSSFKLTVDVFLMSYMTLWTFTSSPILFAFYALFGAVMLLLYFPKGPKEYYSENTLSLMHYLWGFAVWSLLFPIASMLCDGLGQRGVLTLWLIGTPLVAYIARSMHSQEASKLRREDILSSPENTMQYTGTVLYHLSSIDAGASE